MRTLLGQSTQAVRPGGHAQKRIQPIVISPRELFGPKMVSADPNTTKDKRARCFCHAGSPEIRGLAHHASLRICPSQEKGETEDDRTNFGCGVGSQGTITENIHSLNLVVSPGWLFGRNET